MSKRAKFLTKQGTLTISRGVATVEGGEGGGTKTYVLDTFAPTQLTKWKQSDRQIAFSVNEGGVAKLLAFDIVATPAQLRETARKSWAEAEHARLSRIATDYFGQEALQTFEKKYSKYLPKPTKAKKAEAKPEVEAKPAKAKKAS